MRLIVQGLERIRLLDFVATEPYLVARVEAAPEPRRPGDGDRGAAARGGRPLPPAGGGVPGAAGRAGGGRRERHRSPPGGLPGRLGGAPRRGRAAGDPRAGPGRGQAAAAGRPAPARARRARAGPEDHHRDRGAADQDAARVLPARAAPLDPAGAGRGGRGDSRGRRAAPQDRGGRPARGGAARGGARAGPARQHPAGLARARHDPHLSRVDGEPALEQAERRRDRHPPGARRSWTRTTTTWRRSRTGSSSTWRSRSCARSGRSGRAPSSDGGPPAPAEPPPRDRRPPGAGADPLLRRAARASARRASARASPARSAGGSCACRSAACTTRRRSAATGGPTSARSPAASSRRCGAPRRATRSSCSTRSTRSAPTGAAIPPRRCWRCSIRPRTTPSSTTTWACRSTSRRCCSSPPPTPLDTIPAPLRDRMEVLPLSGYTDEEKVEIAQQYLVPKQLAAHGLTPEELSFEPEAHPPDRARLHARGGRAEPGAGDRHRRPQGGPPARRGAARAGPRSPPDNLVEYLGRPRFFDEVAERTDRPGVATGLAWTPTGGDVLFVEATMMPSSEERLVLTGMLGDVMRESAQAASPTCGRTPRRSTSTRSSSRARRSTSTCRPGPSPRTGPRPG